MQTNLLKSPKLGLEIPRCRHDNFEPNSSFSLAAPVFSSESVAMFYTLMRFFSVKDIDANGKEMAEQLFWEGQTCKF